MPVARIAVALCAFAVALPAATPPPGSSQDAGSSPQSQVPVFRSKAALVPVTVTAVDRESKPVVAAFQRTFVLHATEVPAYVKAVAYEYGTDRLGSRSLKLTTAK